MSGLCGTAPERQCGRKGFPCMGTATFHVAFLESVPQGLHYRDQALLSSQRAGS